MVQIPNIMHTEGNGQFYLYN